MNCNAPALQFVGSLADLVGQQTRQARIGHAQPGVEDVAIVYLWAVTGARALVGHLPGYPSRVGRHGGPALPELALEHHDDLGSRVVRRDRRAQRRAPAADDQYVCIDPLVDVHVASAFF